MAKYRGASGKTKTWRRPQPLVLEMGVALEKLVDSRKDNEDVLRLIPRCDFFLDYVFLVLRYRECILDPGADIDEQLEEEIAEKERLGPALGFPLQRLIATARAVTELTPDLRRVAEWKKKVLQTKKQLSNN